MLSNMREGPGYPSGFTLPRPAAPDGLRTCPNDRSSERSASGRDRLSVMSRFRRTLGGVHAPGDHFRTGSFGMVANRNRGLEDRGGAPIDLFHVAVAVERGDLTHGGERAEHHFGRQSRQPL